MTRPTSPMWLTHHDADQHDRCASVRGHLVCRRCLVLYPAMLVVAAVQLSGVIPPSWGVAAMWVLPLPVVAEWTAEHLGGARYSARRQIVTTGLASLAFGVALGRHVRHPFELAATAPAVTFTTVCLLVWIAGARRRDPHSADWEAAFDVAEANRLEDLAALLAQPASQTKSMSSSTAPTSDGSRSL